MNHPVLRFIRRGQTVTLHDVPPSRTLLELLREDLSCTDTKEGCAEGDCGACTVVLAELEPTSPATEPAALRYRAVNSCIRLAHSINGLALWTAQDLDSDPLLVPAACSHPVQTALVQCHGSQCGFCTPGFVMSLFGLYQNQPSGQAVTREQAQVALSGNLCRCTGYRPIVDAAQHMSALPPVHVNEAALRQQLSALHTTAASAPAPSYLAPDNLADLLAARAAQPQAQIVAGCTDVGLWITQRHQQFAQLLDVTRVAELRQVLRQPDHLAMGAAVTLTDAFDALVADRPELRAFTERFAGLPVRNAGTLGGNVANGSPIGDSMPLLIALHARVVLASVRGSRELPLENLYTGYRQNIMAADEVLAWIKVPLPASAHGEPSGAAHKEFLRAYKISKRQDDDISAVCLVVRLSVADGRIAEASIGVGGVAATPVRAVQTEASLRGQPMSAASFERAAAVLCAEFSPISDMRASASYRRTVLGNLLRRCWLESQGQANVSLATLNLEPAA